MFYKYKYVGCFLLILSVCVALSLWLSRYIPDSYFDQVITPILVACTTIVALFGAWLMSRHSDGLRIRKAWGYTLLVWGAIDGIYLVCWLMSPMKIMNIGAYQLTTYELLIGNLLGWLLLLYPTETLRPHWLTLKKALWQLLPICVLVVLDYVVPFPLAIVLSLYPLVLLALLITHIRAYRVWCEENFSTLDDIDVQWVMRYLIMIALIGLVFLYICLTHHHTRGFTQFWLVIFMFIYSTEQILFRRDPWHLPHQSESPEGIEPKAECLPEETGETGTVSEAHPAYREALEHWMESEKPYLNPDFRLLDLRQVLPLNRTYLSQFIRAQYDCTFYQFVNRYRIDDAKRLMKDNPDMKIAEVSGRCGFSSPTVFSRTFATIAGITPREWSKRIHSSQKLGKLR